MLVKFFGNRGGGSAGATMNYLLGKADGEVEILKGDPKLSQKIAEGLSFKNAYTVGALSFEERATTISRQQKMEIIERFEKTFFAGLNKTQYNITWIQHSDKTTNDGKNPNRLELNFFIPNVEMSSGKRLQPYYDKADRPLAENFKQVINHEYKLSDPNDPEKRQTFTLDRNMPKTKQEAIRAISDYIEGNVLNGKINDRTDVLRAIESVGFEIARVTNKNISIKDPDGGQNIRLKGAFYEQTFRASELDGEKYRARIEEYRNNAEQRYHTARDKLASATSKREREYQQRYPDRASEITKSYQVQFSNEQIKNNNHSITNNNIVHSVPSDELFSERTISRNASMGTIGRNLQENEQRDKHSALPNIPESEITLRGDRSEISGNTLEQWNGNVSNNQNLSNTNQGETEINDGNGRTFFDNLKEFGQNLLGRASNFAETIKEFGERLFGIESKLRSNSSVIEQVEHRTSENERTISANEPTLQREQAVMDNQKTKQKELTLV